MTCGYSAGKTYVVGEVQWISPLDEAPPRGVKLHILQGGCVSIQSIWDDNSGYIAWQRMFKRDVVKEEAYLNFLIMRKKAN